VADPNDPKPASDESHPSPEEENLFPMSEESVDEADFPVPDRDFLHEAAGEGKVAEPDLAGELPQFDAEGFAEPAPAGEPGELPQFDAASELAGELPPFDADEFAEPVSTGEPADGPSPEGPESDYLPELVGEGLPGEAEEPMAEEPLPEPELAEAAGPKRPPAWLAYLDWAGVIVLIGVIWGLASTMTAHLVLNGIFLTLLVLIPFLLWKLRRLWTAAEATPLYTVMLAISVVALLTAAYCLGLALAHYEWQLKANGTRVAASTPCVRQLPG
jgi:hypothetical protein